MGAAFIAGSCRVPGGDGGDRSVPGDKLGTPLALQGAEGSRVPVAVALAAGRLCHPSPPLQLQENRGVYNYIPLAVHLFIRSNVLGLERMFEQEPPQQQKAERNANRLRARQRWKPRAGATHAASPS